jgi:superfamily II DNA or RNA helicase
VQDWVGPGADLGEFINRQTQACLSVYREDPRRVEEDAAIEVTAAEGGYGRKQLFELLQNAADALRGSPGRIDAILTDRSLYVANGGKPFTEVGAQSLLASHLSSKSGEDIGQFGLGFKSVTAISDHVAIFSRSASFTFDRDRSAQTISAAGLASPRYPMLRLAEVIEPGPESERDPVLASLMTWASTIVRVSLKAGQRTLAEDIEKFPAAFLLFSPDITEMHLDDRGASLHRTFRRSTNDVGEVLISDNEQTSRWIVESTIHQLTRRALEDAGEIIRRPVVEVSWAVPVPGARGLGSVWAYFPTNIQTTLSGIANAPWKLSSDRLAMVPGDYNEELLIEVLPGLVARGLARMKSSGDPAALLDALPARGKEARSWADDKINEPIFEATSKATCVPDQDGTLRRPAQLTLHPAGLPQAWKEAWSTSRPGSWVHHSVDRTAERRLKAERLIAGGRGSTVSLTSWIDAVAADGEPDASAAALRLAAKIISTNRDYLPDVRRAHIVLLEDGQLARPERGKIFLRSEEGSSDHDFIHPDLAKITGVGDALATLGIEVLNPAGELRAALQAAPESLAWTRIWHLSREVDVETALLIFREELPPPLTRSVAARMKSGKWRHLERCFLAGEVIPGDGLRDAEYLIDPVFHTRDEALLERCGAVSSPRLVSGLPDEPWLVGYKAQRAERYCNQLPSQNALQPDRVAVVGPDVPWPLELMSSLTLPGKAAITRRILDFACYERWKVMHATSNHFPVKSIPNPAAVRIVNYGALPTSIGPVDPSICLSPDSPLPDCFPKADVSTSWAEALKLPEDCSGWGEAEWEAFLRDTETRRPADRTTVYALAARTGVPAPQSILAQRSVNGTMRVAPGDAAATDDAEVYSSLMLAGIPALLTTDAADHADLVNHWGLADGRDMLREEIVAHPDSEPTLLIDRYPPLRIYDREIADLDNLLVQTCSAIDVLISTPKGQETRAVLFHRSEDVLHVINGSEQQILERLADALRVRVNVHLVIDQMERQARSKLRLDIRAADDLAEKLVIAVGEDKLRARLPKTAIDDLERAKRSPLSPSELAELALSVHGYLVLSELRPELTEAGLEPPRVWAGSREARKFVEGLGFPPEYAGFPGANLSPVLDVDGPVTLSPLHDYQERVVERIRDLLTLPRTEKRGMVTLPTGAGKTRVAVEAVIQIAAAKPLGGPVIWIGQSEELCEQAVQAWAYVWRAIGRGSMTISRFWRGNEASEAGPETFQVVVATIDKLREAIDKPAYEWLKESALIIVDEAHTSIAPSYTNVFRWLGGESITTRMTTPLLGLTATAYRGHNEEETKRLVGRYSHNQLDDGVFGEEEPYHYLQKRGMLAHVQQEVLSGMNIAWTPELERHLGQFGTLPRDVENSVGQNFERNQVILESITRQPDEWTTLLFASSVEHARALAAELSYYGIASRPISGATDPALRRRYIEQFRDGDIRVLTNYAVLTQGFDAPKVQAVYVTRPTFSPNLYQQMIGRGLRGPLNGGSEQVLIVNVADNLEQYGGQLAFHHFDYLWRPDQ